MSPKTEKPVFETPRLRAGHWHRGLAEEAFAIYGDPEVGRFIGGHNPDLETMRKGIEMILERGPNLPEGMGSFPLFLRADPDLPMLGAALIKPLPDAEDQRTEDIEIGWHLAREHWGKGFATEAGEALLELGFERLDLPTLHAVVKLENHASHAVAQRIGMLVMGTTTAYYGGTELVHYRIERDRWRIERQRQTS